MARRELARFYLGAAQCGVARACRRPHPLPTRRCNANGSRQFRRLQEQGDWDGCVEMGREQVKEGSHTLDLCTAFVGRNEIADMTEAVTRMRGAVNAPLVVDSTEYPVLEAALKL